MKKKIIIILSLIANISLQASEIPNIGNIISEAKPPKINRKKLPIPQIHQEEDTIIKILNDNKKIFIKEISISGAKHVSDVELKKITSLYENKELNFNDIQEITLAITIMYRKKGFFVSRAYIPKQNIFMQNGMLQINILEGNYGEFYLKNKSLVKDSILQANLDSIKDLNIISTSTFERVMLIISDTPGVNVTKAQIKQGVKVGTSDYIIDAEATKKYSGYAVADNYGSKYTGRHRVMFGADILSPFKIGDKISLYALKSEGSGLLNAKLAYDFPLHENGLRGELSYSKITYSLGQEYNELGASGTSNSLGFKITYPLIRSQLENLNLYIDTSHNKMKDKIQNNIFSKYSNSAKIGAEYTKDFLLLKKNVQSRADLSFTGGELHQDDILNDGKKSKTNFYRVNLDLRNKFYLTDKIKWENTLQTQYTLGNHSLDRRGDLSIGGISGVRFYPTAEESAENGYIFNTELFYSLPNSTKLNSSVSIFYDIGRVFMKNNITNNVTRTLQDFGFGYYGRYNDLFIKSQISYGIRNKVSSEKNYNSKFLIQVGWVF